MNKKIGLMAVLASFSAFAATNYDLLGRKGSKMNSPMVYRDIDYSKARSRIQKNSLSSSESNALARQGLNGNTVAIEGRAYYRGTVKFILKTLKQSGSTLTANDYYYHQPTNYINKANTVFTPVNSTTSNPSNMVTAPATTTANYNVRYEYSNVYDNAPVETSYIDEGTINVKSLSYLASKSHDTRSINPSYSSKVGVYIANKAKPTKFSSKEDVRFVDLDNGCSYTRAFHGLEMISTRAAATLNRVATNHVIYGHNTRCGDVSSPESKSPQVYMGLRVSGGESNQWNNAYTATYDTDAENLDNYIYNNHTIEIVSAGNFGTRQKYMAAEAHAANAITVGAVNPLNDNYIPSSSWQNDNIRIEKPEIANYTNFYFSPMYSSDKMKKVHYNPNEYTYEPYFAGTEGAASYTAAQVVNVLTEHPFYRWHPEVIKALLLTSSTNTIGNTDSDRGAKGVVSANGLAFDESDNQQFSNTGHDSRYWIGNFDKLKTHTSSNGKKEIHFAVGSIRPNCNYRAAISWLSKGSDIKRLSKVPQDIDLLVFATPNETEKLYRLNDFVRVFG